MARIRSIKPGFFTSEDVSRLPLRARLTWIGLWTHCDDQGRAKDNVKLIKAAVWPLDPVTLREIEEDLATLAAHGRIVRYEVDGRRYLAVTNWSDHQKPNRPTTSRLPAPPKNPPPVTDSEPDDSPTDHESLTEDSSTAHTRRGGERRGVGEVSPRAREAQAVRWLRDRYRLTDHEASRVLADVTARAGAPLAHPIPYLDAMSEGDLADIAAAVMSPAADPGVDPSEPDRPPWCGQCDERTRMAGHPDHPRRCPTCHPLREEGL